MEKKCINMSVVPKLTVSHNTGSHEKFPGMLRGRHESQHLEVRGRQDLSSGLWRVERVPLQFCVGALLPSSDLSTLHLFPTGPSTQRQVQNGPSPEEMDIQRR